MRQYKGVLFQWTPSHTDELFDPWVWGNDKADKLCKLVRRLIDEDEVAHVCLPHSMITATTFTNTAMETIDPISLEDAERMVHPNKIIDNIIPTSTEIENTIENVRDLLLDDITPRTRSSYTPPRTPPNTRSTRNALATNTNPRTNTA